MKRLKIPLLYILSFVLSVLPVAIYFFMNTDRYIVSSYDGVKLTLGAGMLLVIILLKAMGKLKMPSRTSIFGIVFILCYLLQGILNDMLIFSFLALAGEIMDSICQIFIRRAKRDTQMQKNAEKTAKEIKRVLGRV